VSHVSGRCGPPACKPGGLGCGVPAPGREKLGCGPPTNAVTLLNGRAAEVCLVTSYRARTSRTTKLSMLMKLLDLVNSGVCACQVMKRHNVPTLDLNALVHSHCGPTYTECPLCDNETEYMGIQCGARSAPVPDSKIFIIYSRLGPLCTV
jgi:hypothetical protein